MEDLEATLLREAVGFARARLEKLVDDAAQDGEHLLETVLAPVAPTAGQIQEVQLHATEIKGHLDSARANVTALAGDLSGSVDVAAAKQGIGHLVAALNDIEAAIAAIGAVVPEVAALNDALLRAVRKALAAAGGAADEVSGLLKQLEATAQGAAVSAGIVSTATGFAWEPTANTTPVVLADAEFAKLTLTERTLRASLDFHDVPEPKLAIDLKAGASVGIVSDGLVAELAGGGANAEADLEISLDTADGLTIGGGAKSRITLPVRFQVPGLDLHDLGLDLPAPPPGEPSRVEVTGDLAGSLGPASAVVSGAGVRVLVDTDKLIAGGQAAEQAITIEPIPPSGAGLRVDAAPLRGGGFIERRGTGEYGGALQLRAGPVDVSAFGLIATEPHFSMVVVIGIEFTPAIQLSFGFTLNAVGGLLALDRRLSTEGLREDFSNHTIDSLLFPPDPVAAAPTIINQLDKDFPDQQGAFVVGPMFELGWGTPISFVTAKAGVLIGLPDPKIVLLGLLRVAVPAPEVPIVDLRASIYGEITPEHMLLLADLSGSKVAGFTVAGQIGFLVGFGDSPELAFSAGGFHPAYHDRPPELASLQRVSVDLSPPAIFTLRAEGYLALTSNSFQLGARVDLSAEAGPVGADGHIAFDALVVWSPHFLFVADLDAGIALHAFGETFASVDLHLHLEGPGPWTAHGTASISLLFFDVDLDAGPITWGEGPDAPAELVSPQRKVYDALAEREAWSAQLPPGADMLVTLRAEPENGAILVHPLGSFEARQKAIPLETEIDRMGRNPVSEHRVNLGQPKLGGQDAKAVSHATDHFAPGQFLDLSDDQKLSRPAFEDFPAGVRLAGGSATPFGQPAVSVYAWETVYPHQQLGNKLESLLFLVGMRKGVLAASPAAQAAAAVNPYVQDKEPVAIAGPGQVAIRDRTTLAADGLPEGLLTTTAAAVFVAEQGAPDLELVGPGVAP